MIPNIDETDFRERSDAIRRIFSEAGFGKWYIARAIRELRIDMQRELLEDYRRSIGRSHYRKGNKRLRLTSDVGQ